MMNKIALGLSMLTVACLSVLSSCKEDDPPIAGINFELEEQEVTESDGTLTSFHPDEVTDGEGRVIDAKLIFDIALAGDVVIQFDIDGSARENSTSTEVNDFEIVETGDNVTIDGDKITILKGAAEANFSIRIFEDYNFEFEESSPLNDDDIPYETVVVTLESIVSGPGSIGEKAEHTFKILEDDAYVFLEWNPGDQAGTVGDVDMDLFIYIDGTLAGISNYTNAEFENEFIAIPGGFVEATYGMGYVYKSGTSNDLDFDVQIANLGGTLTKTGVSSGGKVYDFSGKYMSANINTYDPADPSSQIEQTMVKGGLNYTSLAEITIPATGSRQRVIERSSVIKKIQSLNGNSPTVRLK